MEWVRRAVETIVSAARGAVVNVTPAKVWWVARREPLPPGNYGPLVGRQIQELLRGCEKWELCGDRQPCYVYDVQCAKAKLAQLQGAHREVLQH